MNSTINLTQEPETIDFPAGHYVFIERVGNIPANAPGAWHAFEKFMPAIMQRNQVTGPAAFYRPEKGIYRAGFLLAAPPVDLPDELTYEKTNGGRYARFTLTGPFDQLPEANTQAAQIVIGKKIHLRDDFYIERYLTDPSHTPAEKNVTEILFPLA